MGFLWSFKGGLSFNLGDLIDSYRESQHAGRSSVDEVDEVWENYNMGLITNNERYNQIIDKWTYADNRLRIT
jgi:DNA-directed RNA polymerase subunit beta'